MPVKVTQLQAENFKRVRAVQLTPAESGLTVIGGNNDQGKTSVLDAIAWALGGDRFRPSVATREGSVIPPNIKITLSNGLVVTRSGKNSSLKVTDPAGNKSGQQLLNNFVEAFALDLPRFMMASSKEKAATLLQIIGVGDHLAELERQEAEKYQERLAIGRIADQKAAHAREMPFWQDAPDELISASELIQQQQEILARNGENARKRAQKAQIGRELEEVSRQLEDLRSRYAKLSQDYAIASQSAEGLIDESTAELEESIRQVEETNAKVRTNLEKTRAEEDAKNYKDQYDALTGEIEGLRDAKRALLDGADMPLAGLSVDGEELIYHGQRWDNMSGSQQLRVATAIVRRLNPNCGFVLLDKLEQMDTKTLHDFGQWLEAEGLQAIATRVSTGDECSIIIEDGYVRQSAPAAAPMSKPEHPGWQKGVFE